MVNVSHIQDIDNATKEYDIADEYDSPDYNETINKIFELTRGYNIDHIYVDGANPEVLISLKRCLGERFSPEQYKFLAHSNMMLEKGYIEIHPQFDKLRIVEFTDVSI